MTDHGPVHLLKIWIAVKPIVNGRDSRSPHQNHNTKIIKLVSSCCYLFTVVRYDMESVIYLLVGRGVSRSEEEHTMPIGKSI
jgi:hypothetical protein